MFRPFFRNLNNKSIYLPLSYSTSQNPFIKTINALKYDIGKNSDVPTYTYPEHADIVIIGGGYIGSSTAYWLKKRAGEGLSIAILDKDLTVSFALYLL